MAFKFSDLFPPGFNSLPSLYKLLDVKGEAFQKYIYRKPDSNYRVFTILKRNGASRTIRAPRPLLKSAQKALALELSKYYTPKSSSHGFVIDRSVKSNALPHCNKSFVFNIDLKDFFETIHFGRIKNLFMAKPINAPHNVAAVMAHMCCHDGKLAQGAPTSPVISNMICRKLDSQLQALARSKKCHYSRYADDITFSFTCSERHLPKDIVELSSDRVPFAGQELTAIIEANGFFINSEKTRLQNRHQRQMVTGLVVNRFPNLRREYIRKTNSMIDALKKHGAVAAEEKYIELLGGEKAQLFARQTKRIKLDAGDFFIKVLKGRINYIQMVRGRTDPIYRKLAYRLSCALGKENKEFLKTPLELLGGSIFVVNNIIDDNSQGTAFLLKDHGIITNQHVIDGVNLGTAPHAISFSLPGVNKSFSAELVYSNKSEDLAVFYPGPNFSEIKELTRSKRSSIAPLDPIISIGYPKHVEGSGASIATGQTTQLRRNITFDMWCVDAILMTGNSGGPIFNPSMEVIGVAARGADKNSSNSYIYGFIPIATLSKITQTESFKFNWVLAASRAHKTFRHAQLLHRNIITFSRQRTGHIN